MVYYGRNRTTRTLDVEEEILERVEEDPSLSNRHQVLKFRVYKDTENRTSREQLLHPFHLQISQDLLHLILELRLGLYRFINERRTHDENFH